MVRNEPTREEEAVAAPIARCEAVVVVVAVVVESKRGERSSRKRIVDIPNEREGDRESCSCSYLKVERSNMVRKVKKQGR